MIERQNHLKYIADGLHLNPASVERYRFYLRHLLLWAEIQNFSNVQAIRLEVIGVLKETKGESEYTMYVDQGEALCLPLPLSMGIASRLCAPISPWPSHRGKGP